MESIADATRFAKILLAVAVLLVMSCSSKTEEERRFEREFKSSLQTKAEDYQKLRQHIMAMKDTAITYLRQHVQDTTDAHSSFIAQAILIRLTDAAAVARFEDLPTVRTQSGGMRYIVGRRLDSLMLPLFVEKIWQRLGNEEAIIASIPVLTQRKDRRSLVLLLELTKASEPKAIRLAAMSAIDDMGFKDRLSEVEDILNDDEDPKIRSVTALTLAEIGASNARRLIENALQDDESSEVRKNAAVGLAMIGNPESTDALIESLQKDDSAKVRLYAASALGTLGDSTSLKKLDKLARKNPGVETMRLIQLAKKAIEARYEQKH